MGKATPHTPPTAPKKVSEKKVSKRPLELHHHVQHVIVLANRDLEKSRSRFFPQSIC